MDPPPLEPVEAKSITSRDIVEFHKEQAFRLGQLGFTTNFPDPSEIFRPRPINPELSPFDEPASDEEVVKNAALSTHNSLIQLQQQGRLIAANTPLVAEASHEIDRKLLDAGKSKRYVAAQPLRQKVMDAIEIGTPSPKPNFVTVFINTPWTVKKDDMLQVNLPLKATIDEAVQLLGDIMRAESMAHQGFIGEVAGCDDVNAGWKYQLVSRNPTQVINEASVRLETEIDYREMMQQITKTKGKTPIAVLAQVWIAFTDEHLCRWWLLTCVLGTHNFRTDHGQEGVRCLQRARYGGRHERATGR